MPTRPKRRFPVPTSTIAGPFVGMRDSQAPAVADPTLAQSLTNWYVPPGVGGELRARPGITRVALMSATTGYAQQVIGHTTLAGVRYTFFVVGGALWRFNWSTLTETNVTPVGVTIDASAARVYGVSFLDWLIVSDGVNRPWKASNLSATPITGAYLTDAAGAWYGRPAVYYGKLFGIQAANRTTIEWSEEADPDTGYTNADYDNTWVLGQSDTDPLTAIHGTNDALTYWREFSCGAIRGQVTANFSTDGVHDGLSTSVGTTSPDTVCPVGTAVWFADALGRPHAIEGGQVVPRWTDLAETLSLFSGTPPDRGSLVRAWMRHAPEQEVVVYGFSDGSGPVGQSHVPYLYAFHAPTGRALGRWTLPSGASYANAAGVVALTTDSNRPAFVMLGAGGGGWVLRLTTEYESNAVNYDNNGTTSVAVPVTLVTAPLVYEVEAEHVTDELTITGRRNYLGVAPTWTVRTRTSAGTWGSARTPSPAATVVALQLQDVRTRVGLNARGRWVQVELTNANDAVVSSRAVVGQLALRGTAVAVNEGAA